MQNENIDLKVWHRDIAYSSFLEGSLVVLLIHPTFHWILQFLPFNIPDSLNVRLMGTIPCVILSIFLWLVPGLKRFSIIFSVLGLSALMISTHLLVIQADNHFLYLSSALVAVFGMQFVLSSKASVFWLNGICFLSLVAMEFFLDKSDKQLFMIGFFLSSYFISTVMTIVRVRSQDREFELRNEILIKNKQIEEDRAKTFQGARLASLGTMASGMAHEINNPLAIIITNSKILSRGLDKCTFEDKTTEDRVRSTVANIEKMSMRISEIIKGLRSMTGNYQKTQVTQVRFSECLDNVMLIVKAQIEDLGITLNIDCGQDIICVARKEELEQVLFTLIHNSMDALQNSSDKVITILARNKGDCVEIKVSDSGNPMTEEVKIRLFEPFFTTNPIGQGMGLNLAVSKGLVEGFKGTIVFDGTSSMTTFVITLPIQMS